VKRGEGKERDRGRDRGREREKVPGKSKLGLLGIALARSEADLKAFEGSLSRCWSITILLNT
jgi:hypothetical protein